MVLSLRNLAIFSALASLATAQTYSTCNPLNETCGDDAALGTEHTWYFNDTLDSTVWNMSTGVMNITSDGGGFTISEEGDSTLLQSNFYIFFGVVESWVKMATGQGVVSSIVLESDDLDEIDWEWVGYNNSEVQTNFFGKGNTTSYDRGENFYVDDAYNNYHNYTTYWTSSKTEWWLDGELKRTLHYNDSLALYGKNYPQTPCQVKVSCWPAGQESASVGTIQWAHGLVEWENGPFTMWVQSIRVQDFHTGKSYSYGDKTGSYTSIKVNEPTANSTVKTEIETVKTPSLTLSQKWAKLSNGVHIGVYTAAGVVGAAIVGAFLFWCLKQRKQGRLEQALGDTNYDAQRNEMQAYQNNWKQSEWKQNNGYQQVNS
ncbi:Concanavalin A-like lectin/glucanase subgroup [Penicillium taxi]|uniref:Concanavalin A-like lectin/glucanase subgroup n=1 Tax=Penicillium taxi TaxID=168475 RepID=UPI0025458CE9|nr:Concanavalin A-like lectin/glucanase subgroup [Penicillium taxi]KAJ5885236.1 Concanavalin A-like lectin/glucanase subgroup [Penicillium taxi]